MECKKKNIKDGISQLQDYLRFSTSELGVWFNGKERVLDFDNRYFDSIQLLNSYDSSPDVEGINFYSFSLKNNNYQPSGSANFSKIDNIKMSFKFNKNVSYNNGLILKVFCNSFNVFRILYNIGGIAFEK